jgi:hypothetical protein
MAGLIGLWLKYQSLINEALREHIAHSREPLEATLRPVIREGIPRTG